MMMYPRDDSSGYCYSVIVRKGTSFFYLHSALLSALSVFTYLHNTLLWVTFLFREPLPATVDDEPLFGKGCVEF